MSNDLTAKYISHLKKHMLKKDIEPPAEIIPDKNFHQYMDDDDLNSSPCWYIGSFDKPALALYGSIADDEIYRWALKRKDYGEEALFQEKLQKMKKLAEKSRTDALVKQKDSDFEDDPLPDPDCEHDNAVVSRLARLTVFDYDRCRNLEAARLNIRPSTLDKVVAIARKQNADYLGGKTSEESGNEQLLLEL